MVNTDALLLSVSYYHSYLTLLYGPIENRLIRSSYYHLIILCIYETKMVANIIQAVHFIVFLFQGHFILILIVDTSFPSRQRICKVFWLRSDDVRYLDTVWVILYGKAVSGTIR
jgi:hypothetical protein